ncbi:MAG TPA: 23S rRNA (uracil(1939)-C(5))-methyltransferase RlmD, partial [bacterium]|nr:23S rRNA (uracil(1939)-C(5))-methyltransferase RlmD [bacterium]
MTPRQAPPRAPRRLAGAGRPVRLRPGQKVTVIFEAMDAEGMAVGRAGGQPVRVPFAVPGEEALVEIVRPGRAATGRIAALLRKSPETTAPRCRHFGVCGGCQWQHLADDAQRRLKTALVRQYLGPLLGDAPVAEAVGAAPWAYRSRLQATFGRRAERLVAGFYAADEMRRIINVRECPIQMPANVAALEAARAALAATGWSVYDPATRRGLLRGLIVQTAQATGELMVILSASGELPDRMACVRALRDALPALVSVFLSVQPRHTPELLGRCVLLWGRPYVDEEIAGVRLRLGPRPDIPPAPQAAVQWLEAIGAALAPGPLDVVVDTACGDGFVPLWLARRARRVIGVAADRAAMHRAWDQARLNGTSNCLFYTREPARVVAKLSARGERIDAALVA